MWILRSYLRKMPSLQVVPTVIRVWTRWPSSVDLLDLSNRLRLSGPRGASLVTAPGVCGRPVLDHRGLRRLFKDGARSLLAHSVSCRSCATEVVQDRLIPSSARLLRAPRCVRPSRFVVLSVQPRSRDAAPGGRRFVSTASHGVFKVCALTAGSLRDDSHHHGAPNSGPLPPFGVLSFRSSRGPHRSPSIGISCARPSPSSKLHLRGEFGDSG